MKYLRLLPLLIFTALLCGCAGGAPGIDGVAIDQFTIVADDAYGFTAADYAAKLQTAVAEKYGVTLPIISDETETTAHEIVICSGGAHREVPEMEAGALVQDGHLFLYAPTNEELGAVVDRFIAAMLSGDAPKAITNDRIVKKMTAPAYAQTVITVTGSTPKERGDNLRAAVMGLDMNATAENPKEYVLELSDGEYLLTEPIEIGYSTHVRLKFVAAEGTSPIITGAVTLPDDAFTKVEGENYYVADLDGIKARDIYAGGHRIPLARTQLDQTHGEFPNQEDRSDPVNSEGLYMPKELIESLGSLEGSVEATFYMEWMFHRIPVTGVDMNDTRSDYGEEEVKVRFNPDTLHTFARTAHAWMNLDGRSYYYANHVSLLTPGSCVSDYNNGKLYYYPESGAPTGVSYAVAENLFVLTNAQNVSFEGITFTGTACHLTTESGYCSEQANMEVRYGTGLFLGALALDNCYHIEVERCTFRGLGNNGIRVEHGTNGLTVADCVFDDIAMAAISAGDYHDDYYNKKYTDIVIYNNLMENIAMEYPSCPAIFFTHADGIDILHNTIQNVAYSGMSLGWGWSQVGFDYYGTQANVRRANIAYNRITDYMQITSDGGAIYLLSGNANIEHQALFNQLHHNYAENDNKKHRSYYLDACASNWHVYDNISIGAQFPVFCQFHHEPSLTYNNLVERLYAAQLIDSGNYNAERNVIVRDCYDGLRNLETILKIYPEAAVIVEEAGVIKSE